MCQIKKKHRNMFWGSHGDNYTYWKSCTLYIPPWKAISGAEIMPRQLVLGSYYYPM